MECAKNMECRELKRLFSQRKDKLVELLGSGELDRGRAQRIEGAVDEIDFLLCTLGQYAAGGMRGSEMVGPMESSSNTAVAKRDLGFQSMLGRLFSRKPKPSTQSFLMSESSC